MSDKNQLILNPLTGRYVKKFGSNYLRLVAQGTIQGDPVITAPMSESITEPVQTRNDRGLIHELTEVAAEKKDALKGLSRAELDDLLSKALYEKLITRPTAPRSAALPKVGQPAPTRPRGITARPVPITRSAAAPLTAAMRSKKALMDAQAYADSDTDSDESGDVSIGSTDIETSVQEGSESEQSAMEDLVSISARVRASLAGGRR